MRQIVQVLEQQQAINDKITPSNTRNRAEKCVKNSPRNLNEKRFLGIFGKKRRKRNQLGLLRCSVPLIGI